MSRWIKIISFVYPQDAYLAKNLLEASDIIVIIKDDLTIQVNNFYSNLIGGVKLFVPADQAEDALSILKEAGYIIDADADSNSSANKSENFPIEYSKKCPYCNNINIIKQKKPNYIFALSILLLGFPILFIKKKYFCFDCDKEWSVKK